MSTAVVALLGVVVVAVTLVTLYALRVTQRWRLDELHEPKPPPELEPAEPAPVPVKLHLFQGTSTYCIDGTGNGISVTFSDGRRFWSGESVVWFLDGDEHRELTWDETNDLKDELRGLLARKKLTLNDVQINDLKVEG